MLKGNGIKTNPMLNDRGFTLLEIIAVLVILSILAVVAVPKYFDLQQEARNKALKTALAEGIGRMNSYFAQQVLAGRTPGQIDYTATTLGTNMGDFILTVSNGSSTSAPNDITITVQGRTDTPLNGASTTKVVSRPGNI